MVEYTNNVKKVEVKKSVGIDLGVKAFVVTSDNEVIENPKHLTKNQEHLTVLQRKLARAKKGSNNYKKIKKSISKIHEKVVNTRENFLHNESKKLVDNLKFEKKCEEGPVLRERADKLVDICDEVYNIINDFSIYY